MLDDQNNRYVQVYKMARDKIQDFENSHVQLRLIGSRISDGRQYNRPSASEIAVLIVGDIGCSTEKRDIIVQFKDVICNKSVSYIHRIYPYNIHFFFLMKRTYIGLEFHIQKGMVKVPRLVDQGIN